MRSKEVEEALKKLTQYTFVGSKVTQCEACECIDIAINYIKKLEEENTDAKEYADDVWRKQEELRAEKEKLQDELIEEKQINVKCLKLRDEEYIKKTVIRDKIKEYQDNMKKYEYADKNIFNENNIRQEVITVLNELLGE